MVILRPVPVDIGLISRHGEIFRSRDCDFGVQEPYGAAPVVSSVAAEDSVSSREFCAVFNLDSPTLACGIVIAEL